MRADAQLREHGQLLRGGGELLERRRRLHVVAPFRVGGLGMQRAQVVVVVQDAQGVVHYKGPIGGIDEDQRVVEGRAQVDGVVAVPPDDIPLIVGHGVEVARALRDHPVEQVRVHLAQVVHRPLEAAQLREHLAALGQVLVGQQGGERHVRGQRHRGMERTDDGETARVGALRMPVAELERPPAVQYRPRGGGARIDRALASRVDGEVKQPPIGDRCVGPTQCRRARAPHGDAHGCGDRRLALRSDGSDEWLRWKL